MLVLFSAQPWVEALCFAVFGKRATVASWRYGRVRSYHPRLSVKTIEQVQWGYADGMYVTASSMCMVSCHSSHCHTLRCYGAGSMPKYDVVVAYNTLGWLGLGRMGEALQPWGDIQAVARSWCVAAKKAWLVMGVQVRSGAAKPGRLVYNARPEYSHDMVARMTANWRYNRTYGGSQTRVLVYQRMPSM